MKTASASAEPNRRSVAQPRLDRDDPRKYFSCEIILDVPDDISRELKPGMTIDATIEIERHSQAMVVPKSAVIKKEDGFVLFVKRSEGEYAEVPVIIRASDHGFFLVDGLAAGQEVCLRHPYSDQELRLPDFNAPAGGARSERFVVIFN